MERGNCNCCGSTEHRVIYTRPDAHFFPDEFFTVVECQNCGLGFVNPRPSREEIGRFYPTAFYDRFVEEQEYHEKRYQIEAKYLEGLTDRPGQKRLLDIGCANGEFPRFMRKLGWQVEGVEVSENSRQITDFKIYTEEFDKIPLYEPRYDALTAWAVLEHVHDPVAYFRKAAQVLKPGGIFVFLVTNFNSISSRYLFLEDIPRHLYFFTEATINRYVESCGLRLRQVDYTDKIYSMIPENWLRYYVHKFILRRALTWQDVPESRQQYLERHRLPDNLKSNIQYALRHPLTVFERRAARLVGKLQIMLRNYGIVIYVTQKK